MSYQVTPVTYILNMIFISKAINLWTNWVIPLSKWILVFKTNYCAWLGSYATKMLFFKSLWCWVYDSYWFWLNGKLVSPKQWIQGILLCLISGGCSDFTKILLISWTLPARNHYCYLLFLRYHIWINNSTLLLFSFVKSLLKSHMNTGFLYEW